MSMQRIIGLVLLIGGIILIVMGVTASRSFGDRLSNFLQGTLPKPPCGTLIGGIALAVVGLVLMVKRFGR